MHIMLNLYINYIIIGYMMVVIINKFYDEVNISLFLSFSLSTFP